MEKMDIKIQLLSLMESGVYLNKEDLRQIGEEMDYTSSKEDRGEVLSDLFANAEKAAKKKVLCEALNKKIGKRLEVYSVLQKKYPDAAGLVQSWKIRADKMTDLLKEESE